MSDLTSDLMYQINGDKIPNYRSNNNRYNEIFFELKVKFPWINLSQYAGVSEPYTDEYLNENVVRSCLILKEAFTLLGNQDFGLAHRLFSLDSNTSMLSVTKLFVEDQPIWVNQEMFILSVTEHYEEYNKPCNPKMLTYKEYGIIAPQETLETFNLDLTDLNNDTAFSILVDSNNQIIAKRRYTNFDTNDTSSFLASWQTYYIMYAKKAKRMDLIRNMFSKSYIIR
jgi:hypothetical protein